MNPGGDAVTNARLGLWLGGSLLLHALVVQFVDVSAVSSPRPSGSLQVTLLNAAAHDGGVMSATVGPAQLPVVTSGEYPTQVVAAAPPAIAGQVPSTVEAVVAAVVDPILPVADEPVVAIEAHRATENLVARQPDKVRSREKVRHGKSTPTTQAAVKSATPQAKPAVAGTQPAAVAARSPTGDKSADARIDQLLSPAAAPRKGNNELLQAQQPRHARDQATATSLANVSTASNVETGSAAARLAGHESATGAAAESGAQISPETSVDAQGHAAFLQLLHAAIDGNKRYPHMARRMRREGVATVLFRIHPDGDLDALTLADSSGFAALDEAALRAVAAVAPFAPATRFLTRETRFRVGVKFHLH